MSLAGDAEAPLIDFIARELIRGGDHQLEADDDLLSSGLVDSLGVMRLIHFLEERYRVSVPPEDVTLENFMTVRAIAGYLEGLIGKQSDD